MGGVVMNANRSLPKTMIVSKEQPIDKMGVYPQREQKQCENSTIDMEEKKEEETARSEMEGCQQQQQKMAFVVDRLEKATFNDALIPELRFASDCSSNSDGSKGRFQTDSPSRRLVSSSERDSTGSLTSLNGLPLTPSESNVEDNEVTNNLSPIVSTEEGISVGTGSPRPRSISWGTVTTRKYPIIPGDHPDTYEGPPLTIDWNYVSESQKTVDEYEAKRGPRKREEELRLGWITRRQMLRRLGVSDDELREAQNIAKKGREQRDATLARLKFQKVEEIKQRLFRGLGRAFHPKKAVQTRY